MVSVVLCTYNREKTICESVDSILAQTYRDFELIIIDDGSTDKTAELLAQYHDERIKYTCLPENSYYCHAANIGIGQATGEYVAFATSDDIWVPEKLEKQVRYLEEHPECGAVFSKIALIGKDGEKVETDYPDIFNIYEQENRSQSEWMEFFFEVGNCLSHPSSVVRKSLLDKIGGYNLLFAQLADYDLWIRVVAEEDIYIFPERYVKYRWYSSKEQISNPTEEKWIRTKHEHTLIKRNLLQDLPDEKLQEFFSQKFRNQKSSSEVELKFERAFLMMDKGVDFTRSRVSGFEMLEEALHLPGAVDVLRDHFGMRIQDLYKDNGEVWYQDVTKEYVDYLEMLEADREIVRQAYDEVMQSTCWKLTKPLRALLDRTKQR